MSQARPHLNREEAAKQEMSRTVIPRPLAWMMVASFVAVILPVPVVQLAREAGARRTGRLAWPPVWDILRAPARAWRASCSLADRGPVSRALFFDRSLLREMQEWEKALEDNSWLTHAILPPAQAILSGAPGVGNEKAYLGRAGWLFYRPGVEYVTGPGFLDTRSQQRRMGAPEEWAEAIQPDPVAAVAAFRDQLASRGIRLVVVPVPDKAQIHPEEFRGGPRETPLQNASWASFAAALAERKVEVFDPAPVLMAYRRKSGRPAYLRTDTHWTAEAMDEVASALAARLEEGGGLGTGGAATWKRESLSITNRGDLAVMLKLPEHAGPAPESATIQVVVNERGELWAADRRAEVLLLGDSFCNIYSLGAMGWGTSAGMAEQVGFHLRRPVDRLARNDSGAHATREMLAQELARGRDRLAGKKVVVWEFAARELSSGNWKPVELRLGQPPATPTFYSPETGRAVRLEGAVETVSAVPRAGRVPYKDHIMTLHVSDLSVDGQPMPGRETVVHLFSMRDHRWTEAAGLRPGDRVRLRVRPWTDVAAQYEAINRSELDDAELLLQEPVFGEWEK